MLIAGANAPLAVQPLRSPVSKSPFTTDICVCFTVNDTEVVCIALAAVAVTVTVYVPGAVDGPTASVSVEEPPALSVDGLKDAVVPAGTPLAPRATDCAAPLATAVEIVEVPLAPWLTVTLSGEEETVKSDATTASATDVVCVALVPVAFTVTV